MSRQVELLTERVHLMELVNDASIDSVMVFDNALNAVYWNKTSEIVTGINKEEALGRHFFDLFPEFKECKDVAHAITQALHGRKSFVPYEKASFRGGCHEHHFVPLMNEAEEVQGVLNIVHDVSYRVKVEKELKSLNRSLVRKNKELKVTNAELLSFSRVTSHDLKEPLHKIYAFAEMIVKKEHLLSEEGKSFFKRIQASLQRMRLLTDDILAYCRINSDMHDSSMVNFNHLVLFVTNDMHEAIAQKEAVVEVGDLPVIKGYRTLLLTMLQNIISNSLKFASDERKPVIKISAEHLAGEDIIHPDASADINYVRVSFTDNGIGFNPKKAEQIFQMFYRVNPLQYPGTGIGLTVCKKIAEVHDGFITADSNGEMGCTINVFLPFSKA